MRGRYVSCSALYKVGRHCFGVPEMITPAQGKLRRGQLEVSTCALCSGVAHNPRAGIDCLRDARSPSWSNQASSSRARLSMGKDANTLEGSRLGPKELGAILPVEAVVQRRPQLRASADDLLVGEVTRRL